VPLGRGKGWWPPQVSRPYLMVELIYRANSCICNWVGPTGYAVLRHAGGGANLGAGGKEAGPLGRVEG
jgi:hypothetical protein